MKKILFAIVLATTLALTSCSEAFDDSLIWDKLNEYGESIKDHEKRIAALEELCKQMNTNISSLQTLVNALEKRDYITSVAPVRKDGEVVGYTITFANSDTITIYHGEDGKDGTNGTNGKDGYTPQIGVMKDTDGVYYWTLDGEWLLDAKGNKIKAQGSDGQNGTNGNNGTNGSDGQDGQNGQDGVTPRLKIENDYWYVSYDNGTTWQQLGKATGEDGKDGQDGNDGADGSDGADGEDGKDGDSIFKSVTQDDEYVYFNLSDGTMITLPKHDKENIQFEDLQVKAICCKNWDTNKDGELSYAEAAAVETLGQAFCYNKDIIAFTELKYFTGITEITGGGFSGCTALWKVVLPHNVRKIGGAAFRECSIQKLVIPESVTEFEGTVFYEFSGGIVLNSNVNFISSSSHDELFYNCNINDITISRNVNSITITGENCTLFSSPNTIENLYIEDLSAWCGIDFPSEYCNPMRFAQNIFIEGKLLEKDLVIPSEVERVGARTFIHNPNITSVKILKGVKSIGDQAFYKLDNLMEISLGEDLESIGNDAFGNNKYRSGVYTISSSAKIPPLGGRFFCEYKDSYNQSKSASMVDVIYVPASSLDLYKSKWLSHNNRIFANPYE